MISRGASTDELREACRKHGHARPSASPACEALFDGVTTLDEVVRETVLEDEADRPIGVSRRVASTSVWPTCRLDAATN